MNDQPTTDQSMTDDTDALDLVNRMSDALNDHVIDGMGEFWSDDMKWYGPAGMATTTTLADFQADQRPFLEAFPDKEAVDDAIFGCGQWAAATGHQNATHLGEYLGIPATGKRVKIRYMDIWRAENGKLVENWVLIDILGWLEQLGIDVLQLVRDKIVSGEIVLETEPTTGAATPDE